MIRRVRLVEPVLLAAALAAAYLLVAPRSADLASALYRAGLFARAGFTVWDDGWYAGHPLPAYSVLFPPLGAWLGVRVVGALAAVAAAGAFAALVRGRPWGRLASAWFAAATVTELLSGRIPFALGMAIGLAALLALRRRRTIVALGLGIATTLASPVAGLFLALAATARAAALCDPGGHMAPLVTTVPRRIRAKPAVLPLAVAAAAAVPGIVLAALFPIGGTEPFAVSAFWPVPAVAAAALVLVPREQRAIRIGAALYALLALVAFLAPTPLGGNAARLGALVAGPVLLLGCGARSHRARLLVLAALTLPLLFWQWTAAVRDSVSATRDPSTTAAYYRPLLTFLETHTHGPVRLEIPFTRQHWEATEVAPHVPLARGWERQLDRERNPLFYRPGLTGRHYRGWLHRNGVSYVALPDAPLDYSARAEARLLRTGAVPGLRPVWHGAHWRVWRVRGARLAHGPGRVIDMHAARVVLHARRAGRIVVKVRYTPYWSVRAGGACVNRARGGWTAVRARGPGRIALVAGIGGSRCAPRTAGTSPSSMG